LKIFWQTGTVITVSAADRPHPVKNGVGDTFTRPLLLAAPPSVASCFFRDISSYFCIPLNFYSPST
jgi:hypothetical protein